MVEFKRIKVHSYFIGREKRKIRREIKNIVDEVYVMYPGCTVDIEVTVKVILDPKIDVLDTEAWKAEQNKMK